jgi:IS5 family transposase
MAIALKGCDQPRKVIMERQSRQPTFTDLALVDLGGTKASAFFARCEAEIPFKTLAESVADVFDDSGTAGGAPHIPVVQMLKILFLQKVFGLSDPMAQEMLEDRISFRRFVGLSADDKTPDYSTISLFRSRLRDKGHADTLFEKTLEVLRDRGLVVNRGTLIDASIIEAPLGGKRPDGSNAGDACASKTFKSGRVYHGYRVHIATDRQGLISDYVFDTAAASEHEHFDHLARRETGAVFADSGCRSKARIEQHRRRGVKAFFCHRRVRGQKQLRPEQVRTNRLIAPIRAFVEHPLAFIKTRLNNRRARYRGLARNALDFALMAVAWNFCRACIYQKQPPRLGLAG